MPPPLPLAGLELANLRWAARESKGRVGLEAHTTGRKGGKGESRQGRDGREADPVCEHRADPLKPLRGKFCRDGSGSDRCRPDGTLSLSPCPSPDRAFELAATKTLCVSRHGLAGEFTHVNELGAFPSSTISLHLRASSGSPSARAATKKPASRRWPLATRGTHGCLEGGATSQASRLQPLTLSSSDISRCF